MSNVTVTGAAEILKALERLDGKDKANTLRRAVRAATKPFIASLKSVAASSNVPRSFQKVPAAKVSTQRGASGREIGATVRPASPLFNIFQPGAGRHEIAPRRVGILAGAAGHGGGGTWDEVGRKRGATFFAHGPVSHPGMASRDILGPAFGQAEGAASKAFADVVFASAGSGEAIG